MDVQNSLTRDEDAAFAEFLNSYPSYKDTMGIDILRQKEYPHLDAEGHVCLDYTGLGLFSSSQRSPNLYGGFGIGLSHTTANLATHAIYMEGGSTESYFRKRILKFLNCDENDYYIVFTANAFSAFKLLGQSYPFHEAQSLLHAYDHECENFEALRECAHANGGLVQSVSLSNPWMKIDGDDLQKKLQGKKKASAQKAIGKGLFAYPYTSRVTGCKNSSRWILDAQANGWHVLLDITSVDAKFSESLGLAVFSPDFLIGSFYYVFGEDPSGFGCLMIKRSVLWNLGDSSRARAIGMVKIITRPTSSSSTDDDPPGPSGHVMDPHMQRFQESPGHRRMCSMHGLSFLADSAAESTSIETAGVQDDRRCIKRSGSDGASIRIGVACPQRNNPELATSTENGDEIGKENFAFMLSRLSSCHSEGEAVASALKEINPTHSHGLVSRFLESGTSTTLSKPPWHAGRLRKIPQASMDVHFACRGLDHADTLRYKGVAIRLRALGNWLVSSLSTLKHPEPSNAKLIRIYSQISPADRGSIIAFTVLDSTGAVLHPKRVQVLADRSSISLRTGTIVGTLSPEVPVAEDGFRDIGCVELPHYKRRVKGEAMQSVHIPVVYVSLGFLNNFSDVYKLWSFISRFLDQNFVSKGLWHYQALNQETIEI